MVIADRLAILVNEVYNNPEAYSGSDFVIATLFFTFQIYCDFSGYSDIAIGLARSMGFDLMKNFDSPYFSKSITEFWRRWHISLSTWFRDYVYIPLGGSKQGKYRTYYELGLSEFNVNLSIILIVILLLLEYLNKFVNLKVYLNNRNVIMRWGFYFILLFTILLYGVYGGDSPEFLYFQF